MWWCDLWFDLAWCDLWLPWRAQNLSDFSWRNFAHKTCTRVKYIRMIPHQHRTSHLRPPPRLHSYKNSWSHTWQTVHNIWPYPSTTMSKRSHQSIPDGGSPQPQQDSAYTKRRKLQFGKSSNDRFHSPKSAVDLSMRKLDPSIPLESQRMKTRYKMIEKGKNTVGYDEYNRLVPGNKRRKIVKHPQTPDHTLDIPNRRWQGLVKAW